MLYYNKEERLMREAVPTDITGGRRTPSLILNPKTVKEAQSEMHEYFANRQFILATLEPREQKVFMLYYGFEDGKPKNISTSGR